MTKTKTKKFCDVKSGDWIFTIQAGWQKVTKVYSKLYTYPIEIKGYSFTIDGRLKMNDKFPSAWTYNPFDSNDQPPNEFTKGQKVLAWNIYEHNAKKRYFSHCENGEYFCFVNGTTEWSSEEETCGWTYCKPYEEPQEQNETPRFDFKPGEVVFAWNDGQKAEDGWHDIFVSFRLGNDYPFVCEGSNWQNARKLTPAERGE